MCCGFSSTWKTEAELTGRKRAAIFNIAALPAAMATNRRSELSTAIGLMSPSFLFSAHNEAPQKTAGTRPVRQRLANSVSHISSWCPASPANALLRSLRFCGRRPSEPPADPGTNNLMTATMSVSRRHKQSPTLGVGGTVGLSDVARAGCSCETTELRSTSSNDAIESSLDAVKLRRRCHRFRTRQTLWRRCCKMVVATLKRSAVELAAREVNIGCIDFRCEAGQMSLTTALTRYSET
jgi:hypothetical protein